MKTLDNRTRLSRLAVQIWFVLYPSGRPGGWTSKVSGTLATLVALCATLNLSADEFLKLDHLKARKIYEFNMPGDRDQDGNALRNAMTYYTLNELQAAKAFTVGAVPKGDTKREFFPYVATHHDTAKRSLDEQAALLRELGYSGAGELAQEFGYHGWGHPKGVTTAQRVAALGKQGLRLILVTGQIRLDQEQPIDLAKVKEVMPALAVQKTTFGVVLLGNRKSDLDAKAVRVLNQIADIAKPHGVQIAIYVHTGDYAQTVEEAVRVVAKVNRPDQVGVIFNLFHWMNVDRARDLKTVLTAARPWLKIVNINGSSDSKAQVLPLDQGDFDLTQVIAVLDEIDYRGPVGLFCWGIGGDARQHLTSSMARWKTLTSQRDVEGAGDLEADDIPRAGGERPSNATVLFDGKETWHGCSTGA